MSSMPADAAPPMFRSLEGEARFREAYETVLRRWPVAHDELDVLTRLGKTHVIASGPKDAPALVLLHSMAATATVWRPNVAELSRQYRVYAVDVPGQAGKSVASERARSRKQMADWFTDMLDALGHRTASIVGCSLGGFLALSQASLTPDRVDRIVLISPAGTFRPFSASFIFAMLVKGPIRRMMGDRRSRDITSLLGPGQTLAPADKAWGELMAVVMADSARPSMAPPVVLGNAELRAIKAPTLLLIGEHERLYEARATLELAMRRMPGLSGAIIPNAHHLGALAQPEDVNDRILRFLAAGASAASLAGRR
jgi:pimeloyl-ACP methyl ester carboxylesterase